MNPLICFQRQGSTRLKFFIWVNKVLLRNSGQPSVTKIYPTLLFYGAFLFIYYHSIKKKCCINQRVCFQFKKKLFQSKKKSVSNWKCSWGSKTFGIFEWIEKSFPVKKCLESFWHRHPAVGICFPIGQICLSDKTTNSAKWASEHHVCVKIT